MGFKEAAILMARIGDGRRSSAAAARGVRQGKRQVVYKRIELDRYEYSVCCTTVSHQYAAICAQPNSVRNGRRWCDKFGTGFARRVKAARRKPGTTWHLDEVFVTLRGEPYLLWRAVDQHGAKLDILLQRRRNKAAAKQFFKRVLASCPEVPRKIDCTTLWTGSFDPDSSVDIVCADDGV
jgi:hypothetical protein